MASKVLAAAAAVALGLSASALAACSQPAEPPVQEQEASTPFDDTRIASGDIDGVTYKSYSENLFLARQPDGSLRLGYNAQDGAGAAGPVSYYTVPESALDQIRRIYDHYSMGEWGHIDGFSQDERYCVSFSDDDKVVRNFYSSNMKLPGGADAKMFQDVRDALYPYTQLDSTARS